jgi:hypothetical protein
MQKVGWMGYPKAGESVFSSVWGSVLRLGLNSVFPKELGKAKAWDLVSVTSSEETLAEAWVVGLALSLAVRLVAIPALPPVVPLERQSVATRPVLAKWVSRQGKE